MQWRCDPTRVMASLFLRFLDHTQRRTTVGRTPLDEWSACRRDLYLTKHNTHNRQTPMPSVGFETTISEGERQQTYALDRAATRTDIYIYIYIYIYIFKYAARTAQTHTRLYHSVNVVLKEIIDVLRSVPKTQLHCVLECGNFLC